MPENYDSGNGRVYYCPVRRQFIQVREAYFYLAKHKDSYAPCTGHWADFIGDAKNNAPMSKQVTVGELKKMVDVEVVGLQNIPGLWYRKCDDEWIGSQVSAAKRNLGRRADMCFEQYPHYKRTRLRFWMCRVDGESEPRFRHWDEGEAVKEAERLASLTGKDVFLLEASTFVRPEKLEPPPEPPLTWKDTVC